MRKILLLLAALAACSGSGDSGAGTPAPAGSDLSGFETARITAGGVEFEVWLAKTPEQRARGFMFATPEQIAPLPDGTPRGMLFIYSSASLLGFWMRNTFVPLDLAYVRSDFTIAEVHPLTPLDETVVRAGEPVQYVLETARGTFGLHGIGTGDLLVIPASALK